jgi:DNA polymerase elongation subunit (family B)
MNYQAKWVLATNPKKLHQLKKETARQKQLGNEVKQLRPKILINGNYGLFGIPAFKYTDIRVAAPISAYGRNTLRLMHGIALSKIDI